MATIQAVLRKKQNKAGLFPIALRITKDRRSIYKYTGQYIDKKYWDKKHSKVKKSHPNAKMLNNFIIQKIAKANSKLIATSTLDNYITLEEVKKEIVQKREIDFFETGELFLERLLLRKKFERHGADKSRLKKIKEFCGKSVLYFREITPLFLRKLETHILEDGKHSPRTVNNYFILIRTIFNIAISERIVDRNIYPFGKGKIQIKAFESEKIGLSREEVQLLESAESLTDAQRLAVHVWLISFYFAGIRVSDVLKLKWSDFKDDRLSYRMGKNKKMVSLKIPEKANNLLEVYRKFKTGKDDFVFPYFNEVDMTDLEYVSRRIHTITRNLNRRLQQVTKTLNIDKRLTMHIARHTFGHLSGDKIPIQTLQKLYRHSSITTTIGYQANFMQKETDEALDKVLAF
ncbi:tyrosine-type recombinase/integrase [Sinomicrobium sp. M5D2P9]